MEQITNQQTRANSREFTLVIIMLAVLTILVSFILFSPPQSSPLPIGKYDSTLKRNIVDAAAYQRYLEDSKMYYQNNLDYKKNILAIILTAFGAWVGAGAAYFFGRENLRESANSLLQLHQQMTGSAKLGTIQVRDIPPKPLDSNFEESATIADVLKKLEADPKLWFLSVNASGKWHIVSKEAIYQYIQNSFKKEPTKTINDANGEIMKKALKDILPELEKDEKMKGFINQFVDVKLDDNANYVNNTMDIKGVFLGIVKDEKGNFVQYFTTSDIRKALLKL